MSTFRIQGSTAAAVTAVASATSNQTLIQANAVRFGVSIYNDSTAILYVKCGANASTSSYTVQIGSQQYWETPFNYAGQVDGVWGAANGNALVTEYV